MAPVPPPRSYAYADIARAARGTEAPPKGGGGHTDLVKLFPCNAHGHWRFQGHLDFRAAPKTTVFEACLTLPPPKRSIGVNFLHL